MLQRSTEHSLPMQACYICQAFCLSILSEYNTVQVSFHGYSSQLETNSYYFVLINLMLGSLKSKLVWDYDWGPTCPDSHSGCCLQFYNCSVEHIILISYAGKYHFNWALFNQLHWFSVCLASSALIATNINLIDQFFIYFLKISR